MKNIQKLSDILKISNAYKHALNKDKLTVNLAGLEPTIWKDKNNTIFDLIKVLSKNHFTVEITTNGSNLYDFSDKYLNSGLSKCRVSIHSFDNNIYKKITGVDNLKKVLEGIKICKKKGIEIHINRVLLNGYADDLQIGLDFIQENNITLKLYDLWWTKRIDEKYSKYYLHWKSIIKEYIKPISIKEKEIKSNQDRDRIIYNLKKGGQVVVKHFDTKIHNKHNICQNCPFKKKCKEPFGSYIHVFSNGNITFCNLREDISFNISHLLNSNDNEDRLSNHLTENFNKILGKTWLDQLNESKLSFYINETCNFNCSFPNEEKNYNSLWCLSSVKSNEIWSNID